MLYISNGIESLPYMANASKAKYISLALLVAASVAASYAALKGDLLSQIESRTWDVRARLIAPASSPDPRIKLITIDQASLDHYAKEEGFTWPWPRSLYVPVIKFLEEAGASGIGFDLIFTESSVSGVKEDEELADALISSVPIVTSVVLEESLGRGDRENTKRGVFLSKLSHKQQSSRLLLGKGSAKVFPDVLLPVPEILQTGEAFGAVNGFQDKDGIFRHAFRGGEVAGTPVLSLPFSLFQATQEAKNLPFLNIDSPLIVNFHGPSGSYETDSIANIISSYVALLEGKTPIIDPAKYKGSYVFIGAEAPGLLDLRPTSISRNFRGVEFHAATFDNLLHGDFIEHAPLSWAVALTAIFSLFASSALLFTHKARSHLGWLSLLLIGFFAAQILFALYGYWMPLAVPLMCVTAAVIGSLGIQYQLEGKEHRFIRSAFKRYVSPQIIEEIVKNPEVLKLGGERKELTIFFSDIEGFSTIAEKMDPSRLVSLLNKYLSEMTSIILASGGTLDKYEGDAIIAFWNAPLPIEDHVNCGVNAALECQRRLAELRAELFSEYGVHPKTRIGIHTGEVTVGNFGSKERFDYSIIGDAANLAARLEGVNKVFGTSIIVSDVVKSRCSATTRRLGKVQVVGREEILDVFEPIGKGHRLSSEEISRFEDGLFAFESGRLKIARQIFESLAGDAPSERYLERIDKETSDTTLWRLTAK